jgi:hypothetical protein
LNFFYQNKAEEKMRKLFVLTIAAAFIAVGLAGSAQALDLTASGTLKVPAERTTKLGPNNDGVIEHTETFSWETGTAYNAGGILTFTLSEGKDLTFMQGTGTAWGFSYNGTVRNPNVTDGSYAINHELDADVAEGDTIDVTPGTPESLDLSALTSNEPDLHSVTANYYAVGGAVLMDGPDAAPILQTLTQYSYADTATDDVIDAIDAQAMLFTGGRTLSNAHTLTIASTNAFPAGTGYAPTFQANDQVLITLSGANAVQGLENVLLTAGASTMAFPVGDNTNEMEITLSNADLLNMGIIAGPSNTDISLDFVLEAKADVELGPRVITATPKLNLASTGNGEIALKGQEIFNIPQNGTRFRLARFSTAGPQVTNVKLTNTSAQAVPFDVRFYEEGGQPTEWTRFAETIPSNDALTVTKEDLMDLLGLEEGMWGFVEYRVHTGIQNVSAQAFMRHATNDFAANIPIPYYDNATDKWSF